MLSSLMAKKNVPYEPQYFLDTATFQHKNGTWRRGSFTWFQRAAPTIRRNKQMRQSVNVFLLQTTTRLHSTSLEILLATKNNSFY